MIPDSEPLPERKIEVYGDSVSAGEVSEAVDYTGEEDPEEKELPSTVTLLATPEQSRILAMMEKDGNLHISLVYRGTKENAAKFIAEQEQALQELYPPETEAVESEPEKGTLVRMKKMIGKGNQLWTTHSR